MFYKSIARPLLFSLDPSFVHKSCLTTGEWLGNSTVMCGAFERLYGYHNSDLVRTVDGLTYHTPFVLAAGFDYNARLVRVLPSFGFGGIEVGSVTARLWGGNAKPQLLRDVARESIIVNKGLKNEGVAVIAERIMSAPRREGFVVGVSVARTNDGKSDSLEDGIADYRYTLNYCTERSVGDYYTINISCPNTHTGELFTDPHYFDLLMSELDTIAHSCPVYIKMPISIPDEQFYALAECAAQHRVNGLIIGNLYKENGRAYSGAPCRTRSTELICLTCSRFGSRFTLIGCGGVSTAEHAREKFDAGASLIQLITGLVYEGPSIVNNCAQGAR